MKSKTIRLILSWGHVMAIIAATLFAANDRVWSQPLLETNSLTFNLVDHPTKNKNVFGTTFDNKGGYVDTWGSNYLMYQLRMTSDPEFFFDHVYVHLIANRGNQNSDASNNLRVALFGVNPVVTGLTDSDAIARSFLNQASVSATFTTYLVGPSSNGPYVEPLANPTSSNDYWLIIYAGGGNANQGYGVKIDTDGPELEYYAPDDPDLSVSYMKNGSLVAAGNLAPADIVPEPSSLSLLAVGLGGVMALRRVRRKAD